MKRISFFAIALSLLLVLTGCFFDFDTSETSRPISSVSGAESSPSAASVPSAESTGQAESMPAESKPEESKPEEPVIPTIAEQVCFESNGVKVTAKSLANDPIWGMEMKFLIENSSDKVVRVRLNSIAINDCMFSSYLSCEVAAGKKANEELSIYTSSLEDAGITAVGTIELYFEVEDSESYDTIYESDCITVQTSLSNPSGYTHDERGKELCNTSGVRIVGRYLESDPIWGESVHILIENTSDVTVTVSADSLSVNGYMITEYFSSTVLPGKVIYDEITLSSSALEDNDITKIEEIELSFVIRNADTYKTIAETDAVKMTIG